MKRSLLTGMAVSLLTLLHIPAVVNADEVAAKLGGRDISLSEVDKNGGSVLYDAAYSLYEARVRSLYKLLADQAMSVEAKRRNVSVADLTETEVISKTTEISDADIDTVIKSKNMDAADPQLRRKVAIALAGERANKRRNEYLATLFKEQGLTVTLPAVGDPPREEIRGEKTAALGPNSAAVEIVVFSDFQCPFCRQMAQTLHQAAQEYPKDVRIIHRFVPLHNDSQALSEAALCAGDQGKFWQYHDGLFREPKVSAANINPLATEIGLDITKFQSCVTSGKQRARVLADQTEATRLGVKGTPTLFINNVRMKGGALPFARLNVEIRNALSRVATSKPAAKPPGA